MRLPTKPSQLPITTGSLPMRLPTATPVASASFGRTSAVDDFDEAHDVGGGEEVHADHVLRAACGLADGVDVEIGRVGGQRRACLHDLAELAEDFLLQRHFLEHCFDHDVFVGERLELRRQRQEPDALVHRRLIDAAELHVALPGRLEARHRLVERFLVVLDDRDRHAGIDQRDRDARAHRAGADHAGLHHGARLDAFEARHLQHFAFGEEDVAHGLGLIGDQQLHEIVALDLFAFLEGSMRRGAHAFDDLFRRHGAARFLQHVSGRLFEGRGIEGLLLLGRALQRLADQRAGIVDRALRAGRRR